MKRIFLSRFALCLLSGTALAQRNPVWSSIDLLVAKADRVVVARISEDDDTSLGADQNATQHGLVTLAVDETLKGEPVSRLQVDPKHSSKWEAVEPKLLCSTCGDHTHRLLVIVSHWGNYPEIVNAIDLDAPSMSDVTGDLRLLTTGNEILQAAREEAHRCPDALDYKQVYGWGPSDTFMPNTLFHGFTVYVPIDERQEKLALHILSSQPREGGHYANDRPAAAGALAFFRSPQNIELLKSLLTDPQIDHEIVGSLNYPVRTAAYRVLKQWNIDVPKPALSIKITEPWDKTIPAQ